MTIESRFSGPSYGKTPSNPRSIPASGGPLPKQTCRGEALVYLFFFFFFEIIYDFSSARTWALSMRHNAVEPLERWLEWL
jgi:hypothetical protein